MKNDIIKQLTPILNDTNAHLNVIANSVKAISADPWVMYGAIISLLVAITAVYAANKDYFNSWFLKPRIQTDRNVLTLRQTSLLISRLTISNSKKQLAKNVAFWIDELWHYENDKWIKASNFLQFPLRWTHINSEYRDLFYARPYALDLCEISCEVNERLCRPREIHLCTLYSGVGGPAVHGLDDIKIGRNKVRITLYCENHSIEHYCIEITWDGSFDKPDFKITKMSSSIFSKSATCS